MTLATWGSQLWGVPQWGQLGGSSSPTTFGQALTYLLANLDTGTPVRVRPFYARQRDQKPVITYRVPTRTHAHTLQGSAGIVDGRASITVWSPSSVEAAELAEAIRYQLEGWRGTVLGDFDVMSLVCQNRRVGMELEGGGKSTAIYSQTWDLFVKYRVPVP